MIVMQMTFQLNWIRWHYIMKNQTLEEEFWLVIYLCSILLLLLFLE